MRFVDFLIIGAGPTGLGASNRLQELGIHNFLILESNSYVGGLSASFKDGAGFTWDAGGHVLFSRSEAFLKRIRGLMGGELLEHERRAMVRIEGQWIDYPFQDHIAQLPHDQAQECLEGIIRVRQTRAGPSAGLPFDVWMEAAFGKGICRLFMEPYNRKVWAVPLHTIGSRWIHDRVSLPRVEDIKSQVSGERAGRKWGPNSTFFYPLSGGTGDIFRRLGRCVTGHVLLKHAAVKVDLEQKTLHTSNGRRFQYNHLLNTSPLDRFLREIAFPVPPPIENAADRLKHNGVAVLGVGISSYNPDKTTWMYFPDPEFPFYRVTNLHNYSPHITPEAGKRMAFLTETAFSSHQPLQPNGLPEKVFHSLKRAGICSPSSQPLSIWQRIEEYGYPIPCLERDRALGAIHPFLEQNGVFSRGRFGGWKYEIGNMDHSFMQGVEWAERMVLGKKEVTYGIP